MHGDEPTGRQLTLALAEWLCGSQAHDPRVARLLDEALLYLLPTINPDGFASHRRENRSVVEAFTPHIAPGKYRKAFRKDSRAVLYCRVCRMHSPVHRHHNPQLGVNFAPVQPL